MSELGATIRQLRLGAGLTQEDVAEALEYGNQYVSRVETGVKQPSWRFLTAFANLLKIPVNNLLAAAGLAPEVSAEDEREWAELVAQFPEARELLDLIQQHREEIPRAIKILKAALEEA